jgi:fructokinase
MMEPIMAESPKLFAGVELGGTKCICVMGSGPGDIRGYEEVPTLAPNETLDQIEAILDRWFCEYGSVKALGVASFGPLDLRATSAHYGHIVSTVKDGWSGTDVAGRLARRFRIPVGLETDVHGAALAERRWGVAKALDNFAYVTVGTGVGVGLIVAGRPVFGINHPEAGHIRVARLPGDSWPGRCRFHSDCVEGLASGPAIAARTGMPADRLPPDHSAWESVAFSLGQLLHTLVLTTAPKRILMGGGVMNGQPHLFNRIRSNLKSSLSGYLQLDELEREFDEYVGPPGFGPFAGPMGALAIAAVTSTVQ